MKMNFKQPRYILPLILLPFLFIFFYIYKGVADPPTSGDPGKDSLQMNVAGVSDQVKNSGLSGKLDAYRDRFKQSDGYTAIGAIQEEQTVAAEPGSLYNEREKRMLDSIDQVMKSRYGGAGHMGNPGQAGTYSSGRGSAGRSSSFAQDRALADALAKMSRPAPVIGPTRSSASEPDAMQLFRQQMALVDSMGKAADPEYKAAQEKKRQHDQLQGDRESEKKLPVSKSISGSSVFNTISAASPEGFINAIVDQNITGYAGSRLRIRLLEDMMAGRFLIKKGTYLFAQINGFSGQRVNLVISSIMQDGHILPVRLEVYDNDGAAGLYVPASAFREFSRELGNNTTQGLTLQQQAENNNQLVMGLLQKMFQSTTTAVGKLIRQNKAKLKYNTLVYLIDPEELRKNQNNY
ncbi:conjugative transposon protein TraM [Pedobacter chinensis]|uniref:Conjugative transposon protein TraM n=1 Tax=Pedobacter chinensis TaxID=2282421 RepID=A0A369PW49_9SPHI|nr:conjugative transposon protein TraM [Pedobacter chinensis]RDC54338.1 conjugative transposon protein TraM [Pedobacter chinensis]